MKRKSLLVWAGLVFATGVFAGLAWNRLSPAPRTPPHLSVGDRLTVHRPTDEVIGTDESSGYPVRRTVRTDLTVYRGLNGSRGRESTADTRLWRIVIGDQVYFAAEEATTTP